MKCPIDETEMIEGKTETLNGTEVRWLPKETGMHIGIQGEIIKAFKCSKCGKVEFKIEGENK